MKWFLFFFYDPQNQRFSKTVGSDATYYVYSNGKLLGEYDDSGALLVEYVYLNGRPLAQVVQGVSTEEITYFHVDHQGTPRVGTDSTGASVWTWSYLGNAFGDIAPTGTATVNLRFAGQYYDSESDLFYNWNRYYDPATGRYVSSDPIGLAGGLNTFAYAMANPALYTDPEGLCFFCPLLPWIVPVLEGMGAAATGYGTVATAGGIMKGTVDPKEGAADIATGLVCNAIGLGAMKGASYIDDMVRSKIFRDAVTKVDDKIPASWTRSETDLGGGRRWTNPNNTNEQVRIQRGKRESDFPNSRCPYARCRDKAGDYRGADGSKSPSGGNGNFDEETHIPTEELDTNILDDIYNF